MSWGWPRATFLSGRLFIKEQEFHPTSWNVSTIGRSKRWAHKRGGVKVIRGQLGGRYLFAVRLTGTSKNSPAPWR